MANAQAKYVIKLEDKTKRAFKAIGKSLKRTTSAVFSMKTGFVSAAGIAGIGYFVKKSLDATDEMAKMSRAIGVSVENLQRLRHAASLGGLEATQLDKAVQKLSVNMADMSKGIGLAKDVFDKYNISVTNSDGTLRDTVDVMADVADVTAGLTNKTEKADLAYKLFGARGGKMINVLEGGSVAMREAMFEADKLGLVMSEDTAKGVEKANDAFTRLGSYLTSSFHRAVANLAPLIEKITNGVREWVEMKIDKAGGIGEVARSMANMVILATVSIVKAIQNVGNAIFNLGRQFEQLPFMGSKSTKKLKKEIGDLEGYILSTKSRIADGGIAGIFGMDESTLESQLKKLGELKEQLKNSKNTFTNIEAIDLSHIVSSLESMLLPVQQTTEAADKLKDSFNLGGDKGKGDKTKKTIWDKMKAGFEDYKETVKKGSLDIASITAKTMKSTEDAIVNMMMGVKTDFRSMARSIAADLVRMQVQRNITKPLDKIISNIDFSDFFKASGGAVKGGQTYMVGERGAELFTPGASGTITPNHELGAGGQVVNVTYAPQVNALDPRTAATVIAQNAPTIVGVIRQAFNRNGKAVAI